jgi:hypothetical protein
LLLSAPMRADHEQQRDRNGEDGAHPAGHI